LQARALHALRTKKRGGTTTLGNAPQQAAEECETSRATRSSLRKYFRWESSGSASDSQVTHFR